MAHLIELKTMSDTRGNLTVLDRILPFEIKRIFYIYGVPANQERGGHAHKLNRMALISIHGSCVISIKREGLKKDFHLTNPRQCLILEPADYHWMRNFSHDGVLMVIASEHFDGDDYIYEEPS